MKSTKLTRLILTITVVAPFFATWRNLGLMRRYSYDNEMWNLSHEDIVPIKTYNIDYSTHSFANYSHSIHEVGIDDNTIIRRPTIFFHVGPRKTATTTIQCSLRKYETMAVWKDLGVKVLSTRDCKRRNLINDEFLPFKCFKYWTKLKPNICWMQYRNMIHDLYTNENITTFIISNEELDTLRLSKETWEDIVRQILADFDSEFEINFILTYRNYWEQYLSRYKQKYANTLYQRKRMRIWPKDEGKIVPTIIEFIEDTAGALSTPQQIESFRYVSANNSKVHFSMMDFHSKTNIMKDFLSLLKIEEKIRDEFVNETEGVSHMNKATTSETIIAQDRLAIATYQAALVPQNVTRHTLRNQIGRYFEEMEFSSKELPLVCPSNEFTSKLLSKSIEFHKLSFPSSNDVEVKAELSMKFEKDMNMFCYLNTTAFLESKSFQQYLTSLYTI